MADSLAGHFQQFFQRGNGIAYVQPRGYRTIRRTYRQVAELAWQFARALEERGIGKGDRILLWGPNSAEWVAAFFGCVLRGVVVVPMDDAAAPDFAQRVAAQVSAKWMVCSPEHLKDISPPALSFENFAEALAHHSSSAFTPVEAGSGDLLEIVFTSGTTAEPKGVVITQGNVMANIAPLEVEITKYLKYERWVHPVRFLNLLPLSHMFGQFMSMFLPPLFAGTVIFQDTLKPSEIITAIRRERVSVLVSVPRVLQSLKEKIERDLQDVGQLEKFQKRLQKAAGKHFLRHWWTFRKIHSTLGWKFWAFISGGAALDGVTEEFWGRLGYAVIQGYGLTETTSLISVNHPFHLGKGSIGKVLKGRELKLAEDGEILIRGGGVATGYWSEQKMQPVTREEGWYHTGDIGALDAQGQLYFKGRKKDVIVTPAGMNIYPADLEAALRLEPEVTDCVVIALPREGNAEACAVLILREGDSNADPVMLRVNESLAEYQRMRHWLVWPEGDFPRTSTQKPRVGEIQLWVLGKLQDKTGSNLPASPLADLIGKISGRSPVALSPAANLEADLQLSSLDRVELLSALEDRYQLDLGETQFSAVQTVGELEQMLRGKKPASTPYHYPRWTQCWPAHCLRMAADYLLLRPLVFLLGWPRVEGRGNLRGVKGPVLVVCNHLSDVDFALVLTALPARIRHRVATATSGEALEMLRTPPNTRNIFAKIYDRMKWTLAVLLFNLFPLPREGGFRQSFAYMGETVDRGYSVLIFPEGRHTQDGRLNSFRSGIGLLSDNLALPIVPMRIDGIFELKQAGKKFAPPGKIRITIGAPVRFETETDPQQIAERLQKIVAAL